MSAKSDQTEAWSAAGRGHHVNGQLPFLGLVGVLLAMGADREWRRCPQELGTKKILKSFVCLCTTYSQGRKEMHIKFFTLYSTPPQWSLGKCFSLPLTNQMNEANNSESQHAHTSHCAGCCCVSHVLTHLIFMITLCSRCYDYIHFTKKEHGDTEQFSDLPKVPELESGGD